MVVLFVPTKFPKETMTKDIEEAIIQMADSMGDVEVLETETPLDEMTGIYGLPKGLITEFWGEENTGKSTAALQAVAAAQKQGLKCLWVDVEHSLALNHARALGVDTKKMGVLAGLTAENILDKLLDEVKSGKWDVIVMDSIGSLSSRAWFEKQVGDKTIGTQASILTRFVQLGVAYIKQHKTVFIGVNHARIDMNGRLYQMGGKLWSEKKKLSIRFRLKSGVVLKSGETVLGKVIILKVTKNHVGATEGKEMDVHLINETGFSVEANLLQKALDKGIITKEGNTHFMNGEKLGMIGKVREMLKEEEFVTKLKEALEKI